MTGGFLFGTRDRWLERGMVVREDEDVLLESKSTKRQIGKIEIRNSEQCGKSQMENGKWKVESEVTSLMNNE